MIETVSSWIALIAANETALALFVLSLTSIVLYKVPAIFVKMGNALKNVFSYNITIKHDDRLFELASNWLEAQNYIFLKNYRTALAWGETDKNITMKDISLIPDDGTSIIRGSKTSPWAALTTTTERSKAA